VTDRTHLLCIGDLGIDHVIRVPRLPGRDEKIGGTLVARSPGGMAANVAVGATRLGTTARLVAPTGDDAVGQEVREALAREGVDASHVAVRAGAHTFFCMILLDESGEKALVRAEGAAFLPVPPELSPDTFRGIDHAHLIHPDADLFAKAQRLAREVGATLSLDLETTDLPADDARLAALVRDVDILFFGAGTRAVVERRLGPVRAKEGKMIVTTRGARGAELDDGGRCAEVAGVATGAVDTLGAGDAFAAAFLHARLAGRAPQQALAFANAAGALATRSFGAQAGMARADEVDAMLSDMSQQDA
jgi:ribokinase